MSIKIGVFDSGLGGGIFASYLQDKIPQHQFIFEADHTIHRPYSTKTEQYVSERAHVMTQSLVAQGCQIIVVACNTATVSAIHDLRQNFPHIHFVGTVPAIKPAAEQLPAHSKIAVICTYRTAKSQYLKDLCQPYNEKHQIDIIGTTDLVNAIEENQDQQFDITRELLKQQHDGIVLGCTHFLKVKNFIKEIQPQAKIYDQLEGVHKRVLTILTTELWYNNHSLDL